MAQTQIWQKPVLLENIAGYPEAIVPGKVLLVYNPQASAEEVRTWLKADAAVFAGAQPINVLAPGRFFARLQPGKTWRNAMTLMEYPYRVDMVTPWRKNSGGNERGILNEVYVKLRWG